MRHFYKIDDALDIKLIVLYTLRESPKPLTSQQLAHVVLSGADINFFEIYQALEFLIMADEVYTYKGMEGAALYQLTDQGAQTAIHFYMRIPLEVREYLKHELDTMFAEIRKARQLTARPVPVGLHDFAAECRLCDNDLPLLEMNFYAGTFDDAKKMCDRFLEGHSNIYETLFKMMATDESKQD